MNLPIRQFSRRRILLIKLTSSTSTENRFIHIANRCLAILSASVLGLHINSLLQRQDLLAVMTQIVRPSTDQVHIRVDMSKEDMDSFVFCVASKKSAIRLSRDMADLVRIQI